MEIISQNKAEQVTEKKPRGPRRLEYLPMKYRGISGIEHLTTARQLENLEKWLSTPVEKRAVYVKLGCSVSHGEKRINNPPRSTWVALVSRQAQIIHLVMDPRSAFKWVSCKARPWNIAAQYEPKPEVARYWIAVMERVDGYVLEANGSTIASVTRRKFRRGPFQGKMELLVEGRMGWWEQDGLREKVIKVRAAFEEIYSGEDGSVWVSAAVIKPFPPNTFSDWVLMESNREAVADVDNYIENRAVEKIWDELDFANVARPIPASDEEIIRSVIRKVNLNEVAPNGLDALVPYVADLLTAVGGK